MTKNDFLYILADGIQQHEGWTIGSRSVINNNPGNIKYVGQALASGHDQSNFAECKTPLSGKLLQINDLMLKLTKLTTIRQIITAYAPPSDNDTAAYISSIVMFFNKRSIPVTADMPIQEILNLPIDMILVAINNIWGPADWQSIQSSIETVASLMPGFGFSTRYVNRPILQTDFYENQSPMGNLYALNESVTKSILAPLNEGQKFSVLFYLVIKNGEAGGVQYGGEAISSLNLTSAFCNVLYEGSAFTDPTARALFHELIHCLFTLTGLPDTLHAYLVAHGGYQQDLVVDLQAVYAPIVAEYRSGTKIVAVATQAVSIAQTAVKSDPQNPYIVQLLISLGNLLGSWLQKK